jgi:hypothetical protein
VRALIDFQGEKQQQCLNFTARWLQSGLPANAVSSGRISLSCDLA